MRATPQVTRRPEGSSSENVDSSLASTESRLQKLQRESEERTDAFKMKMNILWGRKSFFRENHA